METFCRVNSNKECKKHRFHISLIIKKAVFSLSFLLSVGVYAQNSGIGINPTGNLPDPSAGLDIDFNNKGLLIPRLTTVQRDAIQNPAVGLQIYNTTVDCLQAYMPTTGWRDIACDCSVFPSSAFTFPNNSGANANVTFQATTSGANYSWVFGQGSPATSNQQSPIVTWGTAGTYNVTLTVTDNLGCSSTTTQTITIVNCNSNPGSVTFNYTGSPDQWTVPNICADSVNVDVQAAQGHANGVTNLGMGGRVQTRMHVTPGQIFHIYVGGEGNGGTGGWNGGGNGSPGANGSGGGGASDIRTGGATLNDRVVVAGGGGGTGHNCGSNSAGGGHGGGLTGQSGCLYSCSSCQYTGAGGTQNAGGLQPQTAHSSCTQINNGTFGVGGSNIGSSYGTGGGGGWYGGGSGCFEGAGGGSSYTDPTVCSGIVTHTQGFKQGHGQITISW